MIRGTIKMWNSERGFASSYAVMASLTVPPPEKHDIEGRSRSKIKDNYNARKCQPGHQHDANAPEQVSPNMEILVHSSRARHKRSGGLGGALTRRHFPPI